jgi:tripeptide aminopeptidase
VIALTPPVIDADELAVFAAIAAPTGAEERRLQWLERRLSDSPGERRRDGVGNLIWSNGDARLLVMAHVDTVFEEIAAPTIERDGDWLVGPGVGDNAAAVMAVLWALEREGPAPGVAVAFTVGEEGLGNLRGAREVCAALTPARAIAVEGHNLDHVVCDHVGSVRARIAVAGPGGHSWRDRGTPSAVHELVQVASALTAQRANIGRIAGGGAVNAIASEAELLVELRSLDEDELDLFAQRLQTIAVAAPLAVETEIVGRRGAGQIDPDHPLVRRAIAVRGELGLAPELGAGSTDANAAAAIGIPAIGIGCSEGSGMHTPHERIDLRTLEQGLAQVRMLLATAAD